MHICFYHKNDNPHKFLWLCVHLLPGSDDTAQCLKVHTSDEISVIPDIPKPAESLYSFCSVPLFLQTLQVPAEVSKMLSYSPPNNLIKQIKASASLPAHNQITQEKSGICFLSFILNSYRFSSLYSLSLHNRRIKSSFSVSFYFCTGTFLLYSFIAASAPCEIMISTAFAAFSIASSTSFLSSVENLPRT